MVSGEVLLRVVLGGLLEYPETKERVLARYPEMVGVMADPVQAVKQWYECTKGAEGPFGFLMLKKRPRGLLMKMAASPGRLAPPEWPTATPCSVIVEAVGEALRMFRLWGKRPRHHSERVLETILGGGGGSVQPELADGDHREPGTPPTPRRGATPSAQSGPGGAAAEQQGPAVQGGTTETPMCSVAGESPGTGTPATLTAGSVAGLAAAAPHNSQETCTVVT